MTFLLDNHNRVKQYGYPRRGGGYTAAQITVHTYEAPHTRSLLAAATYLLQRTNHGSYHALAGARSPRDVLQLAPWSYETWHSTPNNNWAVGISAVAYAHQWNTIPRGARDNLIGSMAYSASQAAKWLRDTHGRIVEPRWLTRAQAMRKESGFVMHSIMDPGRRQDAGDTFPRAEFLAEYNRLMSDTPTITPASTTPKEFTVSQVKEIISGVAQAVADLRIPVTRSGKSTTRDLVTLVSSIDGQGIHNTAEIAELKGIVQKLAEKTGLTAAEVEAAAKAGSAAGAEKAIADGVDFGTATITFGKDN